MKRRTFLCLLCVICCVASASYAKVLTAKAAAGETIQGTVVGIGDGTTVEALDCEDEESEAEMQEASQK